MGALVVVEHDDGTLLPATLNTVAAATQCSAAVDLLVVGHGCANVAQKASQVSGVRTVLLADDPRLAHRPAEATAALVTAVSQDHVHVLFANSAYGKNTAPRVAALLDVAQVSDVTKVVSPDTFERPIFAGNAIATVRSRDAKRVLTVRTTAFPAVAASGGAAEISAVAVPSLPEGSTFVGNQLSKNDRPELTSAKVVVSGGRALGSAERFDQVLTPLADKLGAAIGASRAAVDAGYAANDLQVGQTGKIVAPELYIACGISGAIQHLAGMKDSKVIVAINKDPEAPIFSVADVGLEADLFEAVPQLVKLL
jgi:electron transfer flavoprotein alpha subunit